jgi:phage gp16-like protein
LQQSLTNKLSNRKVFSKQRTLLQSGVASMEDRVWVKNTKMNFYNFQSCAQKNYNYKTQKEFTHIPSPKVAALQNTLKN